MIYFFDINLKLKKIVNPDNALSAIHEHELNNHIIGSMVMDMSYAKQFIDDVDHFGYYYKGNFYLHRIRRVEDSHINETVTVTGRHIFFEDMLYGLPIDDFRPQNRDAAYILKNTIDTNTRWRTIMTDVTGTLSTNFYRQVPWDVIEWVTENFRVEFEPVILFDGQKINGYQLHVANKLGVNKHKRIPFSRVTELDYEIDYSEIITSLAGYGKGEEVGEGYGRRINIADVDFSRNGVVSPIGSHYMEDANITALYGKDNGEPKYGIVEFPDIEDDELLAEAMYESYLEMSRPKMAFSASVIDVGDVGIGDTQVIVRPKYDVFYSVRIHKMVVNLHDPEDADVELGDYEHFKESKVERKSRQADKEWKKRYASAIQELKRDWDADYEGVIEQIEQGYEQAVIDANANIDAAEVRMQDELDAQRQQMTENINTARDTAIEQAEADAKAKADAVKENLEAFEQTHQQLYDEVTGDIMDIDTFLGDSREVTLDERFYSINESFEERIRRVDSNTFNMLRGSQLNEPDVYTLFTGATLDSSERINFVNVLTSQSSWTAPRVRFEQEVRIEAGKKYIFAVEYRTDSVPELDWFRIQRGDGLTDLIPYSDGELLSIKTDGEWNRAITEFTFDETITGKFEIGTYYASGDGSREPLHIRLPYLTGSENTEWVYHPLDATQNISEVSRRITNLEDGYSELTTRSEFDFKTGNLDQHIKSVEDTVEGNYQVLQRVEDWQATNGSSVEETIYGFEQKVWLNDVANIGANLIPQSRENWEDGGYFSSGNDDDGNTARIRLKRETPIETSPGKQYTFSCDSPDTSGISQWMITQYIDGEPIADSNLFILRRGASTFTAQGNEVLITALEQPSSRVFTHHIENPDKRIFIKLEQGSTATPMLNALSRVEQLADSYSVQIAELDGTYLKQSELDITPDYWQLGSTRIGADDVSSVLRGSPDSIDAIVDEMNLSGNLNVKGQIESLAVSAVTGSFAEIFASTADIGFINGDHIDTNSIRAKHIFVQEAMVEDIMAKNMFSENVKTLGIEAIYADLRSVNSEIMTSNIIKSNWLSVDTALFDRFTASEAFIDRLTVKAANVRDLEAITMDAVQANLTTVMNRMGEVEGGLTIRRPDGAVMIQNGQARGHTPVQLFDSYSDSEVGFTGLNFYTQSSHWKTFKYFYTPHEGTRLRVTWALDLYDGPSNIEYMEVRVRTFTDYKPINMGSGTSVRRATLNKSEGTVYVTQDIPMPPPNYNMMAAYLEFRRAPDGQSINNRVSARILHIGQYE